MSIIFRRKIFEKYNGRCAYCGNQITIDNMTIDHFDPKSKGGSLSIHNCLPSCKRCNEIKADGTIDSMRDKIERSLKSLSRNKDYQILRKYGIVNTTKEPVTFFYEEYMEA